MNHQLARLAKHWTSTSDHKCLLSFSMAKVVQCSAHSCSESEQATWFLINTGFLEAVTQRHQQTRIFLTQGLNVFSKLIFFSVSLYLNLSKSSRLQWRHCSLIWPFARLETVERMVDYAFVPFLRYQHSKSCSSFADGLRKSEFTSESIVVHMNVRANQWCSKRSAWSRFLAYLFVEIPQCCGDNHKRIVRIWITCETDHMGIWSLQSNADGMDCCSPNASVGSVAMGNLELWLYKPSEILKKKHWKTHLCKTLCSLEKKSPKFWFFPNVGTKCAKNSGTESRKITDVKLVATNSLPFR